MDQPYTIVADWLSKFHTWPELIQALGLIAMSATVRGVTWLVMGGLTQILAITSRRDWRGHLIDGVYPDKRGRSMIYWHAREPQEIDWTNPPELIRHDRVT